MLLHFDTAAASVSASAAAAIALASAVDSAATDATTVFELLILFF
jgi:hypothetical protein